MASNNNEQDLLNEQVSFVQHFLPGLDAGEYQLDVSQQVLDADGNPVSGEAYSNSYKFGVTADRFVLSNPENVVSSVFPADNASGELSNVLPHVVFSQKTFPWVRYPTNEEPYSPPPPGTDTDADVPTWLWVMILDEDDVAAYPSLVTTPVTSKIGNLFPEAAYSGSTLEDNYSYFNDATNTNGLEPGQTTEDQIQTIDVPLDLIWQIAPTIADLEQMAHGRVVSLVNQPASPSENDPGEPLGSFSIVFGNRLPATQKKTNAYLVSLEELQDFLPDEEGGGAPSGNTFDGSKLLRLAVLKSWSFFSTGQPATFVHQLEGLNDGNTAANSNIRLEYSGSNTVVAGALNMGYVPLNEVLRTENGQTVSWYRGPLVPYEITDEFVSLPIASPDAATIFDPTTGMLDVSYAAAWTIGRMIALQDVAFSTALYNYKKSLQQQVNTSVEDQMLEETFGAALNLNPPHKRLLVGRDGKAPRGSRSLLKRTIIALNQEEQ
ncbi:MAG: hypothetical protein KDD15_00660 [Lewinella sp.]|nr:hypothetical protein [Lewinella sp.]